MMGQPQQAQSQQQPQDQWTLGRVGSALARGAGLTARGLIQGAAALPAMAGDLAAFPINAVSRLSGGQDVFPPQQQAVSNALTGLGLPQPQNNTESLQQALAMGAGGAVGGMGLGSGLAGATNSTVAGVGNVLRSAPASQVIAGVAAGGSSEIARQQGAGPVVQMAAGLAGGLGAGAIAQKALPKSFNPDYSAQNLPVGATTKLPTVKEQTLREAQDAGYVVSPAATKGNMTGKVLSGLSGKAKTEQLARVKNQDVTDNLARRSIGLSEDAQLTPENIQNVRNGAFNAGYVPVRSLGAINVGPEYARDIRDITQRYSGQGRSFSTALRPDIITMLRSMHVNRFDAGDAIDQIRLLRDEASTAFSGANPDNTLGRAYTEAARALEDQIQRGITQNGGANSREMLMNYRNARRLIARTYNVQDALIEGSGNIDAVKIARSFQKGDPLTGELRTIGAFANNFRESASVPKGADLNPLTVLDFTTMGAGAGMAGMGGLAGAPLMLLPAARVGARYGVLSKAGQKAFTQPSAQSQSRLNPLLLPVYSGSKQ